MRLSVALATYKGERHLQEQLDSLARQTRLPDELVACDDRSPDRTYALLEAFAREAPFPVALSRNDANLGSTGNFERAASLCTGDVVLFCDQDDVWLPDKLARFERAFEEHPDAAAVFSDSTVVDEALRPQGFTMFDARGFDASRRVAFRQDPLAQLIDVNVVTGASMAVRRDALARARPFPREWVHDAWIAIVNAARHDLVPLDAPTMLYRQHAHQALGAARLGVAARLRQSLAWWTSDQRPMMAKDARYWGLAARRIREQGGAAPGREASFARLEERVAHLEARATLPPRRLARLAPVREELRSGRYARHSGGPASAVKDLLLR